MVFVRKSPGRSGTTQVQFAERRDGREVVLAHVGTAHDDAELAAPLTVARKKVYPGQGELPLEGISDPGIDERRGAAAITSRANAVSRVAKVWAKKKVSSREGPLTWGFVRHQGLEPRTR